MSTLIQDVRFAFRTFLRNPGFTTVALLTLALGIGANAAIFGVVDDVLLRPLDMPEPERVVQVRDRLATAGSNLVSAPNFVDYREQNEVFEQIATVESPRPSTFFVKGVERPQKVNGYITSSGLLPLLGVKPILGRTFLPEEDQPDIQPAAILTYGFWQRHFGGDPDVIGKTLTSLSPISEFTIVGVLPPDFHLPPVSHDPGGGFGKSGLAVHFQYEFFISMSYVRRAYYDYRRIRNFAVLARLKPDVVVEQAQANMDGISARITAETAPDMDDYTIIVTPLRQVIYQAYGSGLYFLWAAAGFVLLIVCVNMANLLLVRAVAREREVAVRMALGSGRGRLLRQLLTESTLLGVMGGAVGLLLAFWGTRILVSLLPDYVYRLDEVSLDLRVVVFTLAVSVLTALLFGMLPSIRSARPNLNEALKEGARGSSGSSLRLLRVLVVAEVAMALLLLTGAGLILSSFRNLTNVDPGFDRENILVMEVENLPQNLSEYQGRQAADLLTRIIERVEAVPGVISAAGVDYAPLTGYRYVMDFTLADRPPPPAEERVGIHVFNVTPGYFETMGTSLLAGRKLTMDDQEPFLRLIDRARTIIQQYQSGTKEEQLRIRREYYITPALINETMAQRYWPEESAIGKEFYFGVIDPEDPPMRLFNVVGVVPEVKTKTMDESPRIQTYIPAYNFLPWLVIHTRSDPRGMAEALKVEVEAVDRTEFAVASVRTMEEYYRDATAESRCQMVLIAVFAALATILAAIGLFGVMAYLVVRRTHEIGVRMSLGAQPREIFKLVLGQGMLLTVIGIVIGLAGSFVLARYISSLLFGVSPIDPVILVSVTMLLGGVALLASYIPSRHASRVDPVEALRAD